MLILLGEQYVASAHIVEVIAHPACSDVCVILTNGREVRIERNHGESKAQSVARVARNIMGKASQS